MHASSRLTLALGLLLVLTQLPIAAQAPDAKPAGVAPADGPKKPAKAGDPDLAGATLGMTTADVRNLAKAKGKQLVGPDKRILDMSGIQVSGMSVAKNGNLAGDSGLERQTLMLLADKLIAVELIFKSKTAFDKFLKDLKDRGYEQKEAGYYVGQLQTGEYQGREVEVRTSEFRGAARGGGQRYEVVIRCLKVIGENATEASIRAAQVRQPTKEEKAAVDALQGLTK